jgi:oligopeptide transport system substrate-binding protein
MKKNYIKLLLGTKGEQFCNYIFLFQKRFPKLLSLSKTTEMAKFLLNCPRTILDGSTIYGLARIFFSYHHLTKKAFSSPSKRIHLRIIEIDSSVYGISCILYPLQEHEIFGESQIIEGIQKLIPGVKKTPNSYFSYSNGKTLFFYLEIKKMRGGNFSSDEKDNIRIQLPLDLSQRIEDRSPSLLIPCNMEELIKNIRHLKKEIRSSQDIPQVMLSFSEYSNKVVKFLVIIARVINENTASIQSLSKQLPEMVHFSIENILTLDKLHKKNRKEIVVITVEINSSIFLRNNNTVNLRAARNYVFKILENLLGPCRDYNGGLLIKEDEQLSAIKEVLKKRNSQIIPLFEDLFYGIRPILLRALITPKTGLEIAALFGEALKSPVNGPSEKYCLKFHSSEEADIAIIKTKEKWENSFTQYICGISSQIGYSSLVHDGWLYFCFFHQFPPKHELNSVIHQGLNLQNLKKERQKSFLRINFQSGDPPSLNPRLATDIQCHIISNFLFEGLTRVNEMGQQIPAGAEKIEISPNGLTYTFHLRLNYWSNGEAVTAHHFEQAWKKAISASSGLTRLDLFSPIKNASKARNKTATLDEIGVVAIDKSTLHVELEAPCPFFLNLVSTPPFFPMFGEIQEPVHFNGPFLVSEWKQGVHLQLSQNPFYWKSNHYKIEGIKISMVRNAKEEFRMFQEDELDWIGDPINPLSVDLLKSSTSAKLIRKEISRIFWIHCNTATYPLNNVNLRRALYYAIDRNKLIEKNFYGYEPCLSPLPRKYSFISDQSFDQHEAKAKMYFKLALEELNLAGIDVFPVITMIHSDLSFEASLIQELKEQWKSVLNIEVLSRELPWNEYSATLDKGDFQLAGLFRRDLFNHPMSYLSFFKNSRYNPYGWENKDFEILLDKYLMENDRGIDEAQVLNQKQSDYNLKKIEKLLIEHAPVIPLVNQTYFALTKERINGFDWNLDGSFNLTEVTLNENSI